MAQTNGLSVAGLFAGIGGIERGLTEAGVTAALLCESYEPARSVLRARFGEVPLCDDIREMDRLPDTDLVTAGFPCGDLSQAGRTAGITGEASGLVAEVFRLLSLNRTPMVLFENVRNMLYLDKGAAIRYLVTMLEELGSRWAYRLVDSRFAGVPQRRQRVFLLASRDLDPRRVLLADEHGEPADGRLRDDLFGFYWTEGRGGLGWARDAIPPLKAGSLGIPSPPGIWHPAGELGRRIVTPSISEAESLQRFPRGWTEPAASVCRRSGTRWKLVGNAVTVGVARWIGDRLLSPGVCNDVGTELTSQARWPVAAYGENGRVWAHDASAWPISVPYVHLSEVMDTANAKPLSARATAGFYRRAQRGSLRFVDGFLSDIAAHRDHMERAIC